MLVAEICVNIPAQNIYKNFTYTVPARLNFLSTGWRVMIPFNTRKIDGFVISVREVEDTTKFDFELKEILDVIDDEAWFTPEMIRAAEWLADFYLCPLSRAMTLFMPGQRGKKISPKFEKIFKLKKSFEEEDFKKFSMRRTAVRLKFFELLREKKEINSSELKELKISYPTVKLLIDAGFVCEENRRVLRDSYADVQAMQKKIELNAEQFAAVEAVKNFLLERKFQGFLLHGVTGSGKTQVYIELTKIARKIGRRAVILVPEIALTGQIVHNFKAYFSDIAVIHSGLSVMERSDVFHKIRNGEVSIVIGARSALFTPIENVGLIVVDEEQDNSYKQEKIQPYYQARVVAEQLAKFHNAAIVFGSATPCLENYYRAQIGELIYLELPNRIFNQRLPEVEIVDMRGELRAGNRGALSRPLKNLLEETLKKNQQAILLLNRRGYSTFVMCRSCGFVAHCPNCGRPMVYHQTEKILKCHNCDIRYEPPKVCPICKSDKIKYFGTGTQRLEEHLQMNLPHAKILRMDRDSVDKKFGHREILESFGRGEYDILFGTQMVAKGHDIRNVTAVGILNADFILNFADFRAEEQCFTLITQVAGRAGRAEIPGKVVVQTYNTKAAAIVFACRQDYKNFCKYEFPKRKQNFFPPYSRLVKLWFLSKDEQKARMLGKKVVENFKSEVLPAAENVHEIHGPIPASIEILDGVYQFVVLIQTLNLDAVRNFLRAHELHTMTSVQIDIDPTKTD